MDHLIRNLMTLGAATLLTATAAGCKNEPKAPDTRIFGEKFVSQDEMRDIQRTARAQEASGARADSMLRPFNFDKGALHTSGQAKLDLTIDDDDSNNPLTVYVDAPQDDLWAARVDSITKYCKERSINAEQLKIVQGPNPGDYHPTAPAV